MIKMKKLIILFLLFTMQYSLYTPSIADEPPKRIISLAPSITEIVYALGLGDRLVGVTTYCDYPEEAKKKPKIGGMVNPSLEAVVLLKPDIVVMTIDGNPKEFEERLRLLKVRTFVFKARRLSELPQGIREMGVVLGVKEMADKLASEIETALGRFRDKRQETSKYNDSSLVTRHSSLKKKVLFIIWPEPLIVAGPGSAIDDGINLLGHENIASKAKAPYPKYSVEEVIHQSPDVILIGRQMGRDISEVSQGVLKKMTMVPAVKNGKIFYVSDSLYRLGPRVIKGIEELSGCLN